MFFTKRFYTAGIITVFTLISGYFLPALFIAGQVLTVLLLILSIMDFSLLWYKKKGIDAVRYCAPRFSNGDNNDVRLIIEKHYPFRVDIEVIDEIPVIFQRRDILFRLKMKAGYRQESINYKLRPVKRGIYGFGQIIVYASSRINLVSRRFKCGNPADIAVYPSYIMLHKYEITAIHNNLTEMGIKKIRRIGNNTEFEYIKEYIKGDDYRTINWKASARRRYPMVNIYQDERSQQIYNIIDKGRVMQNAFRGMTLLDYAINASLVLSFVAIRREDKAGLITFATDFETFIPARRQTGQMRQILDSLYRQETTFGESDYSSLFVHVNKFINKRSLLIIYTNFDSVTGMERQIEYLKKLSGRHVVLAVFFEDTELNDFADKRPHSMREYYQQVVAEKFIFDKQLVVSKLRRYGIYSLLTAPGNLSVSVINKYLEMKSRGVI
jgi:uncharacterized protein (DUF58 family)